MEKMMSEQIAELVKALVKFQAKIEPIGKNKEVSQGSFKYNYADLPTIMGTIKLPLVENGLAITQCFNDDNLVTTLWHTSGQWIASSMKFMRENLPIQKEGSEITYRRRYALSAILGLSTEEDDDGTAANDREEPAKKSVWGSKIVSPPVVAEEPINKMEALKEAVEKAGMPSKHILECISNIAYERKDSFNNVASSIFHKVNGVNGIEKFKKAYRTFLENKGAMAI